MANFLLLDPNNVDSNEKRPTVCWGFGNGIRFEDIDEDLFDEVLNLIESEYIPHNILLRSIKLYENKIGIDEYLQFIKYLLKMKYSIVAVDEKLNKIIGVVVMVPMSRVKLSWQKIRLKSFNNQDLNSFIRLHYELATETECTQSKDNFNMEWTMHYFVVCASREYKGMFLQEKLMYYSSKVATVCRIPTVTYLCESTNNHERAERIGMSLANEKHYRNYIDLRTGNQIFVNVGSGQYSVRLYALNCGPSTSTA